MLDKHIIFGVHITERMQRTQDVQRLFSDYGCSIRTRLGLHHTAEDHCSPNGLVLLEMFGDEQTCFELRDKLRQIAGIEVQEMIFEHPK